MPVRLVKGAYWDAEVKRAQIDGHPGYPVFTRKPNTDVSYLANARRMFEHGAALYPMFATHNAQTIAAIRGIDASRITFATGGQQQFARILITSVAALGLGTSTAASASDAQAAAPAQAITTTSRIGPMIVTMLQ